MEFACNVCGTCKKLPHPPIKNIRICNHSTMHVVKCRKCYISMYNILNEDKLCNRCTTNRFKFIL